MKRRFFILQGVVRLALDFVPTLITACDVLHNLAIELKQAEPDEDFSEDADEDINNEADEATAMPSGRGGGQLRRQQITSSHFS
jgi:hypothetical protein